MVPTLDTLALQVLSNLRLLEGLREQIGFQPCFERGVCFGVADGEGEIVPNYRTLRRQ